jgi:hypothetical protein
LNQFIEKMADKKTKVADAINSILQKFGVTSLEVKGKINLMAEATLADGTMVATPQDEIAVGAELYIVPADGSEPTVAPDGEHTLADGSIVVVAEGLITEIKEAVEAEEEEADMSAEITAAISQLAERVAALESQNTELSTNLSAVTTEKKDLAKKLSEAEAKIVKLSKEPATESVRKRVAEKAAPAEKVDLSKMTYKERVRYHLNNN